MPRKIGFTVVHVTGEDTKHKSTELNQHGPTVKGWQSEKSCEFPQELIVKLEFRAVLNRIQVLAHQYLIPEKIELFSSNEDDCSVTDLNWKYLGYITLSDNQSTGFKSRELKSVTVPECEATYLMLRLFKNHENAYNINNQISLIALNILGIQQQDVNQDGIGAIVNSPDYSSPYDDLAFEMYCDTEIAKMIQEMEIKKQSAVLNERFEYARKLKETMEQLKPAGERLGKFELEKRHAIEIEDYERARHKKNQIQQFRNEVYEGLCVEQLLEHEGPCPRNDKIASNLKASSDVSASPIHMARPRSPAVSQSPNRGSFRRRNKSAGAIIKSSYELYEEKPLPALRHSQTNEFLRDEQTEHKAQQQQHTPFKLTEREKKQAALALVIFGTELVEKIYSKYYLDKEEGLESLKIELLKCESGQGANKMARAAIFLLHRALRDKVFSVYSLANEVIRLFFVDFIIRTSISAAEIARSVDKLLPELLTKSGDTSPRIHTMAMHTVLTIADSPAVKPLHLIPVTLSRPLSSSTHPRLALSRAEMVEQLVLSHGISTDKQSGLTCRTLSDFGTSGLHHPAEHVRKVAERILVLVYKTNPRLVRKQLPPDDDITRRNLLYRQLFQEFDKIDARRNQVANNKEPSEHVGNTSVENGAADPSESEICIFCQQSPEEMDLNMHYWRQCPMLVNCRECSQVVEISALVEHLCLECEKRSQYLQCPECGDAISSIAAPDAHASSCKPSLQDGFHRCPLCSEDLPETDWRNHIMCRCPENARRLGSRID